MTRTKFNPLQEAFGSNVLSQVNAGGAGGTMYYINLGGIKLLWLSGASFTGGASGFTTTTVTFPTGFFSTVQASTLGFRPTSFGAVGAKLLYIASPTSTGLSLVYWNSQASTDGVTTDVLVIGT